MINLHSLPTSDTELYTIGTTSPDASDIIDKIIARLSTGAPSEHIYTDDLRVEGHCVQESMDRYLTESIHYQSSHLKDALISPMHFKYASDPDAIQLAAIDAIEQAQHFSLGNYLHQCILEPTKFGRVRIAPDFKLNTTEGVEEAIRWYERELDPTDPYKDTITGSISDKRDYLKGLKLITPIDPVSKSTYLKISILKKHLDHYAGGIIYDLLKHSKREISFYSEIDGVPIKVRPDAIQFEENIGVNAIISVKSTACTDLRTFFDFCARYHYDLSEALYQDVVSKVTGRSFDTTITIMLQTTEPYAIALLVWSSTDIDTGRYKYKTALTTISECVASGQWPGLEAKAANDIGLIATELPGWNGRAFLPEQI